MKKFTNDHRSRVTQLLIRKAFLELLCRKPIQSISIKELCGLAGVSRGTFYAHYQDIYDLFQQIEDDMMEEIASALEPLMEQVNEGSPVALSTRIFEILKDHSDLCTVTLGDYGDKQFAVRLVNLGRDKCIDLYRNYFKNVSTKRLEYFYAFVSGGVISLLRKWLDDGMSATPAEIAQLTEGIMLRGVGVFSDSRQ